MSDIRSILELNELKRNVDAAIDRLKKDSEVLRSDPNKRRVVWTALWVIGALAIVAVVAFLVYKYFVGDASADDDLDISDLVAEDDDDDAPEVIIAHPDAGD